ncbi:hypothetical protein EMIHUDRAFT_249730 [Emiliania huxleyi CCMP1516]|uniref:Peptidase M24 domain-containing protein n=2 Tax=Emiliania huxleyi TaxID=2903 RepID=A0A0D3I602_EMIH1|nr:hypothetical protein EMIHUDRAFT_249730 [Emiliania huxleyi CCMP1516]EOD06687.1 hypothetical protein EMIHUDRAFT_249730 [Emiliania huxleyi CCMP1516]|eukprot:XP_005759116.1 hypothetical protein EMIHUDRAFT_249730 [Emiliania huxleyi CCMP1516]
MRFLRVSSDAPEPAGAFLPPGCATSSGRLWTPRRRDVHWADGWTAVTKDGKPSAQFEHQLLMHESGAEILTARLPFAKLAAALVGGGRATRGHGARIVADAVSDDIGTPFNSSFGTSWDLRHLFSFAPPCTLSPAYHWVRTAGRTAHSSQDSSRGGAT